MSQASVDHPDLMVVAFRFQAVGAIGSLLHLRHVPMTFVQWSVPVVHAWGSKNMNMALATVLSSHQVRPTGAPVWNLMVDCFTPRRDDFVNVGFGSGDVAGYRLGSGGSNSAGAGHYV
jgi:hypothetical protein